MMILALMVQRHELNLFRKPIRGGRFALGQTTHANQNIAALLIEFYTPLGVPRTFTGMASFTITTAGGLACP
jgi:hypothetical protein